MQKEICQSTFLPVRLMYSTEPISNLYTYIVKVNILTNLAKYYENISIHFSGRNRLLHRFVKCVFFIISDNVPINCISSWFKNTHFPTKKYKYICTTYTLKSYSEISFVFSSIRNQSSRRICDGLYSPRRIYKIYFFLKHITYNIRWYLCYTYVYNVRWCL